MELKLAMAYKENELSPRRQKKGRRWARLAGEIGPTRRQTGPASPGHRHAGARKARRISPFHEEKLSGEEQTPD